MTNKNCTLDKVPKVVHHNLEPYDLMIDRTTKWGNPFHKEYIITDDDSIYLVGNTSLAGSNPTRSQSVKLHERYLENNKDLIESLHELSGKVLGCWCKDLGGSGKQCHGDNLVKFYKKIALENLLEF